MTVISWPFPSSEALSTPGAPYVPERPVAVLAVLVRKGGAGRLAPVLAAIAATRGVGGVRVPAGPIAVMVLTSDASAVPVVEEAALDYPFAIQVQTGPVDSGRATRLASNWAASLGAPSASVLVTDVMAA